MKKVRIDRLHIQLKGVSAEVARSVMGGLGREVIAQLAKESRLSSVVPNQRLKTLDAGRVDHSGEDSPAGLRTTIATAVADSISSGTKQSNQRD